MSFLCLLLGYVTVFILFIAVKVILARGTHFKSILINDQGTYSLARLQLVLWVFTILSLQIATIWALLFNDAPGINCTSYQIKFAEPVLWILGMSLTTYVSVKGIDIEYMSRDLIPTDKSDTGIANLIANVIPPKAPPAENNEAKNKTKPELRLDLNKFQMLFWTSLALFFFLCKCEIFINSIYHAESAKDINYCYMDEEEFEKVAKDDNGNNNNQTDSTTLHNNQNNSDRAPVLPTLPISFIVLMGISKGTYIGKQLVPVKKEKKE
eukprot:Anaeramoba_ignava/a482504_22.p2 GENE.a482504_22~~a482504_22.p2  ORF type:complete len:267 (+),score=-1.77 a482504_22:877-1677(+)